MQKYILTDTSKLSESERVEEFEDIRAEQEEVNGYTETLLGQVQAKAAEDSG